MIILPRTYATVPLFVKPVIVGSYFFERKEISGIIFSIFVGGIVYLNIEDI